MATLDALQGGAASGALQKEAWDARIVATFKPAGSVRYATVFFGAFGGSNANLVLGSLGDGANPGIVSPTYIFWSQAMILLATLGGILCGSMCE
jgi:hypothetical protein